MAGILYIVATPIGNLNDMTKRVADTFAAADFIAAEDTRVTVKLLNHLNLKKPLISYYEHNLKERGDYILSRIENGESCALCSDAGMPAISDPGELIVRDAHARGIKVVPIPAASAAITALCVSGQATSRFVFEGFLPTNRRAKKERLAALIHEERTILFYEAPHKLTTTLDDLLEVFGSERSITLCRELTKLHEEIILSTLGDAVNYYKDKAPRGEYVLVMAGAAPVEADSITIEQAVESALQMMREGMSATMAAKQAAQDSNFAKSEIYRLCQEAAKKEQVSL
ncbi:MAG: 16S rRNA (cytidine(1402)-2'-O)-methyltransferase [Oscillospiraceae bacterium]